jgi:hypothetical protein
MKKIDLAMSHARKTSWRMPVPTSAPERMRERNRQNLPINLQA